MKCFKKIFITTFLLLSIGIHAQISINSDNRFDGKGDFSDRYNCIATDATGNVYLGGSTINQDSNRDYLIEKRNSSGTVVWRKILGAPGNGPDEVKQIIVDSQGFTYVTGYGNNTSVGNDFWTLKFSLVGDLIWSRLYNDVNYNQYDQANSLFVDSQGNVIVCGESDRDASSITNDDFLVVKYDANGTLVWAQRYNGAGNAIDRAEKVVCDASNNIYVTGRSNNGADDDYCTIKYAPNGIQQWVQLYDFGGTDRATDMDIDLSGNIYVTGRRDNGNDDDYLTLKYNSQGVIQFTSVFDFVEDDRAEAIDVAADGSFAVTGRSDSNPTALLNYDIYTVRYNASGLQQWASNYIGTGVGDDWGTDIQVSASGKVLVTGFADANATALISNDLVVLCYDASGSSIFNFNPGGTGDDNGKGVAFGPNDEMWACGEITSNLPSIGNRNAALYKLNNSGVATPFTFDGIGDKSDNVRDWVFDSQGNTYLAGYSVNKDKDRDFSIIKFNTAGDTVWSRHFSGTLYGSDEEANSIDIDASGNIVTAGYLKNSGTSSDIFITKHSPLGALLDSVRWDNTMHEADRSYDMHIDATGNIIITGRTDIDPSSTTNDEIIVLKYDNNINLIWSYTYSGLGSGSDRGKFVQIANDGSIYIAARLVNTSGNEDVKLLKLNASGTLAWQQNFDLANGNDDVIDMKLTSNGNIALAISASINSQSIIHDAIIKTYNSSGSEVWSNTFNGTNGENDESVAIFCNSDGSVILCGSTNSGNSNFTNYDVFTRKYDSAGAIQWTNTYSSPEGLDDFADAVTNDNLGSTLVCLHTNIGTSQDIHNEAVIYSIDAQGNNGDTITYAQSDTTQTLNFISIANGTITAAGSIWEPSSQRDIVLIKASTPLLVKILKQNALGNLFPNPSHDFICADIPVKNGKVEYTVFTFTGQSIFTGIINGIENKIDVSKINAGIYLINFKYQDQAGKLQESTFKFTKSSRQ